LINLLASISLIHLTKTAVTEIELKETEKRRNRIKKENIQKLLLDSIFHYSELKVTNDILIIKNFINYAV